VVSYLYRCVEEHLRHHGDAYYEEGKGIRNRVAMFMSTVEKAKLGADRTVPILAEVHATQVQAALDVGKRKEKVKGAAAGVQADLFGGAKGRKS
jgi:hypothetical protein